MDFKISTKASDLNRALFQVTQGLYILTSRVGDKLNGQCLDALMQITNVPPGVAMSVSKHTLTHEMILESGIFVINVLDKNDKGWMEKVKHFGFQTGRKVDKFASVSYEPAENGAPLLPDASTFFECSAVKDKIVDLKTHTLIVGEVTRAGTCDKCEPVSYNEYRMLKR